MYFNPGRRSYSVSYVYGNTIKNVPNPKKKRAQFFFDSLVFAFIATTEAQVTVISLVKYNLGKLSTIWFVLISKMRTETEIAKAQENSGYPRGHGRMPIKTQCCGSGSGIRCFSGSWIWDPG